MSAYEFEQTKVPRRTLFTFTLGTALGIPTGIGLGLVAVDLVRQDKFTTEAQATFLPEKLTEEFNQKFDALFTSLKESNAPKAKNILPNMQGHQFQFDNRTYSLIIADRSFKVQLDTVAIFAGTKTLRIQKPDSNLYFVVDENQLIKILKKKTAENAQSLESNSQDKKADIYKDLTEAFSNLEADFAKWQSQEELKP